MNDDFQLLWNRVVETIMMSKSTLETKSITELQRMSRGMKHDNVSYFEEIFGYQNAILKIVGVLVNQLTNEHEKEIWNEIYWNISERRLGNVQFFNEVQMLSEKMDEFGETVVQICKTKLDKLIKCSECREEVVSVLNLPCGHVVVCQECQRRKAFKRCVECNWPIEEWYVVYL